MPTILGSNSLDESYEINNSLRFNDGDNAHLEKTFSVEKKNIFRDRIKKKIYKIFNLFIVILNIIMCSDE